MGWVRMLHLLVAVPLAFFVPLVVNRPAFPMGWLRWQQRWRVSVLGALAVSSVVLTAVTGTGWGWAAAQTLLVLVGWRLHQDTIFQAIDDPQVIDAPASDLFPASTRMVVLELGDVRRAYPLAWVAFHHIINERLGDTQVATTFCPACQSVVVFDTTATGPLHVATFYNGNMVFADRERTWWQQGTGDALAGARHPASLPMLPFEVLPWSELVAEGRPLTTVVVPPGDLRPFTLPIPGLWERAMRTEWVPGLRASDRDPRLHQRERIVGVADATGAIAWPSAALERRRLIYDPAWKLVLLSHGGSVYALHDGAGMLHAPQATDDGLVDSQTGARWDFRGRPLAGASAALERVPAREEFWYAWSRFHPHTQLGSVE